MRGIASILEAMMPAPGRISDCRFAATARASAYVYDAGI